MSGVVYKFTLEETIPRVNVVVVATPADPPYRFDEISITPGGGPPTEQYPAFRKQFLRYRVDEVLFGEAQAGAVIEVERSSGVTLAAHELYYVKKVSKILPYEEYETSLTGKDVEKDPRRILLLYRFPAAWKWAVDGSEEPMRLRKKIEKLLVGKEPERIIHGKIVGDENAGGLLRALEPGVGDRLPRRPRPGKRRDR